MSRRRLPTPAQTARQGLQAAVLGTCASSTQSALATPLVCSQPQGIRRLYSVPTECRHRRSPGRSRDPSSGASCPQGGRPKNDFERERESFYVFQERSGNPLGRTSAPPVTKLVDAATLRASKQHPELTLAHNISDPKAESFFEALLLVRCILSTIELIADRSDDPF